MIAYQFMLSNYFLQDDKAIEVSLDPSTNVSAIGEHI